MEDEKHEWRNYFDRIGMFCKKCGLEVTGKEIYFAMGDEQKTCELLEALPACHPKWREQAQAVNPRTLRSRSDVS